MYSIYVSNAEIWWIQFPFGCTNIMVIRDNMIRKTTIHDKIDNIFGKF
jgi:hypothetical protein